MIIAIAIAVEVRDQAEADRVKASLKHIMSLNGATGVLNLYDELKNNFIVRTMVNKTANKFRPA